MRLSRNIVKLKLIMKSFFHDLAPKYYFGADTDRLSQPIFRKIVSISMFAPWQTTWLISILIQFSYTVRIPIFWLADLYHVILGCDETTILTSLSWCNRRGLNFSHLSRYFIQLYIFIHLYILYIFTYMHIYRFFSGGSTLYED